MTIFHPEQLAFNESLQTLITAKVGDQRSTFPAKSLDNQA